MRNPARVAALFAAALLPLVGCDQARSPVSPTVPSAPTVPAPVGQITVLSVEPDSGATVKVEPCEPGSDYYCPSRGEARLTFDVQLNQAVTEPWVTVSFYNGLQRCGESGYPTVSQPIAPLRETTATTFTVS